MKKVIPLHPLIEDRNLKLIKVLVDRDKLSYFAGYAYSFREFFLEDNPDLTVLDYFLDNVEVDFNLVVRNSKTFLHEAIGFLAPVVVDYLIKRGVDISFLPNKNAPVYLDFAEEVLQREKENGRKRMIALAEQTVKILKEQTEKLN